MSESNAGPLGFPNNRILSYQFNCKLFLEVTPLAIVKHSVFLVVMKHCKLKLDKIELDKLLTILLSLVKQEFGYSYCRIDVSSEISWL